MFLNRSIFPTEVKGKKKRKEKVNNVTYMIRQCKY